MKKEDVKKIKEALRLIEKHTEEGSSWEVQNWWAVKRIERWLRQWEDGV